MNKTPLSPSATHPVQPRSRSGLVAGAILTGLLTLVPLTTAASDFPSKPIRFIVPFATGGTTSILARALGDRMGPIIGQAVIIENKPGAGGNIGMQVVANAAPDGYTMLMGPIGLAINPALYSKPGYDVFKDFAPVTLYGGVPNVLNVHPDVPVKTVGELIAFAKAHPGTLSFASNGNGTSSHLAAEMLKSAAGLDMVHVPYKGGAPAMQDLIAGQVQLHFDQMPAVKPQIEAGRIRALGVSSAKRSIAAPEIPTLAESGLPGFDMTVWFGVLVPAGTPEPIIQKLNSTIHQVLGNAEFRQWLADRGVDTMQGTPEEFGAFLRSETDRWGKVIKQANIRID